MSITLNRRTYNKALAGLLWLLAWLFSFFLFSKNHLPSIMFNVYFFSNRFTKVNNLVLLKVGQAVPEQWRHTVSVIRCLQVISLAGLFLTYLGLPFLAAETCTKVTIARHILYAKIKSLIDSISQPQRD